MKDTIRILKIICLLTLLYLPIISNVNSVSLDFNDPILSDQKTPPTANRYGNVQFATDNPVIYPQDQEEIQQLVKAKDKLHVISSLFSVSGMADSPGTILSLDNFKEIDCCMNHSIYVGAGVTYRELIPVLKKHNLALESLPENLDMNVVGSIVTGQHGSGNHDKILASQVQEFTMIRADGTLRVWHNQTQEYNTNLVGLGYLGVITGLRLEYVKEYQLKKCIYQDIPYVKFTRRIYEMFFAKKSAVFYSDLTDLKFNSAWLSFTLDHTTQGLLYFFKCNFVNQKLDF